MKVSKLWLQTFFDAQLPATQELADGLMFHAFEVEEIEKFGDDDILDLKVLQRGHDCLAHCGVAKEISAIFKLPLANNPLAEKPDLSKKTHNVEVTIENSELCKRYIAGYIRSVKVGPSPTWLKQRLESIGQKSINNIVDATNFVMFNLGQPLHAFDAGKLKPYKGPSSVNTEDGPLYSMAVRNARAGEKITALDGKEYTLDRSMLVIADGHIDLSIGIAGVKGGMPAGITEETRDIIIESANFDGPLVRKTARALKLRTDASVRFEEVISPEFAAYGMREVVDLILKIAGGELVGFVDEYPKPQQGRSVSVSVDQVQKLLGATFGEKEITDAFTRLGFRFSQKGETFSVEIPFERLDLEISEDLVEEIGRIIGYDKVPALPLPPFSKKPDINANFYWSECIRQFLIERGFSEIYTSVFDEDGERIVLNKIDGVRPYLRGSLAFGMEEYLKKNARTAQMLGLNAVRLFEIGTVFRNDTESVRIAVGILGLKAKKELDSLTKEMEREFKINLKSDGTGGIGMETNLGSSNFEIFTFPLGLVVKNNSIPSSYENLPLSSATRYQPFSRQPFIIRDVAFWCPKDTDADAIEKNIRELAGSLCVNVFLFDRFEKGDRVSLAYRLIFQSPNRTLIEDEINPLMDGVYAALKRGFEIR